MEDALKTRLSQLRAQIALDRAKLEEKERALLLTEEMLRAQDQQPAQNAAPAVTKRDTITGTTEQPKTLKSAMRVVISNLHGKEFNVNDIVSGLPSVNYHLKDQHPKARIATLLGELVGEKFILLVLRGSGNIPHTYKINDTGEDLV